MSIRAIAGAMLLAAFSTVADAGSATVTLTVTATQRQGRVLGEVFADAASFKARAAPVRRFTIEPSGAAQTVLHLPPGRFAIALFQDTSGSGKMQTNMLGMPSVPYGFSNDAQGSFGPPDFNAAAFVVPPAGAVITIHLR